MNKKKKTKSSKLKDLYLDRPTSHGGWPHGHSGSYRDNKTPFYKQIAQYLEDMGLTADVPHARLSESKIIKMIRESLLRNVK